MMRIVLLMIGAVVAISVYEVWVGNWLTFR